MLDTVLIPRAHVRKRYKISEVSLWRWENNPALNFPKPALVVGTRKFFDEADLVAWEAAHDGRTVN